MMLSRTWGEVVKIFKSARVGLFKVSGVAIGCVQMKEVVLGWLVAIDQLEILLAMTGTQSIGFVGNNFVGRSTQGGLDQIGLPDFGPRIYVEATMARNSLIISGLFEVEGLTLERLTLVLNDTPIGKITIPCVFVKSRDIEEQLTFLGTILGMTQHEVGIARKYLFAFSESNCLSMEGGGVCAVAD